MTLVCEMLIGIVNLSSVRIRRKSARSMHQLLGRQVLLATIVATLNLCNWTHAVDAQPFYAGKNITMLISTSPGGSARSRHILRDEVRLTGQILPEMAHHQPSSDTGCGVSFLVQQGPMKSRLLPQTVPTIYELAPASAKSTLNLVDVMVAYTDFDRPFATAPGVPRQTVELLRQGFEKMLADANFVTEAKKLVDWDGASFLTGADLQKRIETTVSQPPEVIKRIKEILKETE